MISQNVRLLRAIGLILLFALIRLIPYSNGNAANLTALNPEQSGWKLVWCDEFDHSGPPDASKWNYEQGLVRNGEPQYYTSHPQNVRVDDGKLVLEAQQEKFLFGRKGKTADYTSGSISTEGRSSWLYGRFEISAKLPPGRFVWPAFWMTGADRQQVRWPKCGEVDIMEYFGRRAPGVFSSVHFFSQDSKHRDHSSQIGGRIVSPTLNSEFHIYALEWYPDRLDFYLDGTKYNTIPISAVDDNGWGAFRKPMCIRLNLALDKFGFPVDPALIPAKFDVRYVRVYQKQGAGL